MHSLLTELDHIRADTTGERLCGQVVFVAHAFAVRLCTQDLLTLATPLLDVIRFHNVPPVAQWAACVDVCSISTGVLCIG